MHLQPGARFHHRHSGDGRNPVSGERVADVACGSGWGGWIQARGGGIVYDLQRAVAVDVRDPGRLGRQGSAG